MYDKAIHIDVLPDLKQPVLITGFDGWGNALNVSRGLVSYLIRELNAEKFGWINPDRFFRYDENRPVVKIESGRLKKFSPPGGAFYAGKTAPDGNDVVLLRADEPVLNWFHFVDSLFCLSESLGIKRIVTLGSMYDNVLHWERIISGVDSDNAQFTDGILKKVKPVDYQGPSAIHAIIQSEGPARGFRCINLWGHCPYYLQGITHHGLISELIGLTGALGGFSVDTGPLEAKWESMQGQIQTLLDNNADLQKVVDQLKKAKTRGTWESMKNGISKDDKVINLTDFFKQK